MNKETLDQIIKSFKAQPVGNGYIDIIVLRENYKQFITDLIENGFVIKSISWWELCEGNKEGNFGLGGPKSHYFDCWFSELSIDVDDIELDEKMTIENQAKFIIDRVEAKTIIFQNEIIAFKKISWLTPAIWLDIPNSWRNEYCLSY